MVSAPFVVPCVWDLKSVLSLNFLTFYLATKYLYIQYNTINITFPQGQLNFFKKSVIINKLLDWFNDKMY